MLGQFVARCRSRQPLSKSPYSAGGGKNDIPNRLKRHFAMFAVPLPSVAAINNIFGTLMKGRFGSGMSPSLVLDHSQGHDTIGLVSTTVKLSRALYSL